MQQTGLMDSLNAIRAIAMDYHQPVCMIVGLQGKAATETAAESASYGVRIIPPILDAMALKYIGIDSRDDTTKISPATTLISPVTHCVSSSASHPFLTEAEYDTARPCPDRVTLARHAA